MHQEITLKKGKESAISRKHPWIFSGAIASNCESLEDGDLVRVISHKKEFLAVGHFQHGSISVRVLSFEDELINAMVIDVIDECIYVQETKTNKYNEAEALIEEIIDNYNDLIARINSGKSKADFRKIVIDFENQSEAFIDKLNALNA